MPAPRTPAEREAALAALFAALQARPREHDFFAVLRRVECLRPELPRFGRALRPSLEALRLGEEPELDFAPAGLAVFDPAARPVPRLGVRFFGLLGPQGPMPLHLTEYVRDQLRSRGDATLARFLDVFHHRLLALFYRAWAQSQPVVHGDRPDDDRFRAWLGASFGDAGDAAPAARLPPQARAFQAGLLGARSRHPEGLAKILSHHFGVPVRIEEHVPQWLAFAQEDRSRLGFARDRPERNHERGAQLGANANAGRRVRDRQYKYRVVLGPVDLARYHAFLPGAPAWRALREWLALYAGLDLRHDVRLVLGRAHVPEPRLGPATWLGPATRLGVSTWIGHGGRSRDRGDLRLRPDTSFLLKRPPPAPPAGAAT
jgi:type VI secretion system protein ImpH